MVLKTWIVLIQYAVNRLMEERLWWVAKEIALRILLWLAWLCLVPLTLTFHLAGYRRLPVLTQRIGHLAAELDCFFKLVRLNQIATQGKHYFILAPAHNVSNASLLDYWRDHITVITHPVACRVLEIMTRGLLMRHEVKTYVLAIGRAARYFQVCAQWGYRPALLQLKLDHEARGNRFLADLGLSEDDWFVCVHAREAGYSSWDESVHDYRNTTVSFLFPAMQEIIDRGGWCIRMGDESMKPLEPMRGVIDYAHNKARSAELDIFLCARCRFFLGNTSGLFLVSSIFGVPSALTNQTPFASTGFRQGDLSIPKHIRRLGHTKFLTSAQILDSPISNFRMSRFYLRAQLELVENSAEEIKDMVFEMLETLEGRFREDPEVDLYRAQFSGRLRPEHYCYGTVGRISATFLLRHKEKFLEPTDQIPEI